jgi:hypothetical protein
MNLRILSSPLTLVSLASLGSLLSFVSIASLAGCSKPNPEDQRKMEEQLAAALSSAMASSSASGASATGGASGGAPTGASGTIQSTCTNKAAAKCTEHLGAEGFDPAQTCKGLAGDGVYAKGPTPCPRDNLIGTCTRTDATSNLNDIDYHYKQAGSTAADLKSICDIQTGVWAAAPAASGGGAKRKK